MILKECISIQKRCVSIRKTCHSGRAMLCIARSGIQFYKFLDPGSRPLQRVLAGMTNFNTASFVKKCMSIGVPYHPLITKGEGMGLFERTHLPDKTTPTLAAARVVVCNATAQWN
jgi:hypothetical protein